MTSSALAELQGQISDARGPQCYRSTSKRQLAQLHRWNFKASSLTQTRWSYQYLRGESSYWQTCKRCPGAGPAPSATSSNWLASYRLPAEWSHQGASFWDDKSTEVGPLHHHIYLNEDAKADIRWWLALLPSWSGTSTVIDPTWQLPPPPTSSSIQTLLARPGSWHSGMENGSTASGAPSPSRCLSTGKNSSWSS